TLRDGLADPAASSAALAQLSRRLAVAADATGTLLALFERLDGFAGADRLKPAIAKLGQARDRLQRLKAIADTASAAAAAGDKLSDAQLAELERLAGEASAALGDLAGRYEPELLPAIVQGFAAAKQAADTAASALRQAIAALPDVRRIVDDAAQGLAAADQALQETIARLPDAAAKLRELADRIRALERQGSLEELISLLRKDATKESEFFAEPVVLSEHRLFPIPNYGSAMSPFFSTLSLWVGALLLVSLLTVDVHAADADSPQSHHVYFGRFLTFWTIALLQSLFVTVGDMALLGTYVADPAPFVLFGALISTLFMLIVYTLVSVFGNVGKALAIVLLVLQLSGSGGTFPIQVTPAFFQAIYPFLPFTYAISLMREAVGGIVPDIVVRDLCLLGVYAALALILGVTLKHWINRVSAKLVKKAKQSGLLH
ncbi:YhgE/Pip domain-containing protein, partial [Paenibacillus sp. GYB003]|uniref:YhgE/Pip domain-containing protein n=1 Tax=Paenibacillus sp. GYB003 TaxID=2994392 RepID=UPI002F96B557